MTMLRISLFFAMIPILFVQFRAYANTVDEILKKTDAIRNPAQEFVMEVEVKSSADQDGPWMGEVSIKGNNKTLIKTLAPKREVGQNYLMLGTDIWAYTPRIKRALRVSLSQKLTGEAANGDIGRMRWHGDYDGKIRKTSSDRWELDLEANKKGLTYDKMRVWIKKNYQPIEAEFLSKTGTVLKRASYSGFEKIHGEVRPTLMKITNALDKEKWSVIRIVKMEPRALPDSLFQKTSLE